MPLRGNQLSPITLLGTSQSQLGNENVRRVSFSTFNPAASVKAPDPSMSKESREGTAILNKAKNSGSNLSFTERLAAKKASRGALSQQTSIEPEPLNEKKRVQFDVNLKEVRTYTPEVSEGSKSSSSDFLDFICDPEQLKPFASSNYPVHFEDDRWNIAKKSFGTSKSNPIANGEMITSFNSSDEGEQLEDCNEKKVEVVETWFPAVGGDHSVKEVKSEPEKDLKKSNSKLNVRHTESSVANSATVVDQVVTEKNDLQMKPHQVGNSIVDPLPIRHSRMEENVSVSSSIPLKESPVMADDDRQEAETRQLKSSVTDSVSKRNLKSSTIDEIVSKTDKGDLKNLDVSSKGPQKVKLESSLVVKPGQNRKPVPILAFESSDIDEDGENSNVLAKGSPNDHQEPKSVHTAQKLTEESHSEVKLHQTKTFQVNPLPVIDLDTSKVNLGKDQVISKAKPQSVHVVRKVTDESNSDMRFDPSVSPVKYPVPISERKNDAVASSVHVVQLIPEDNPEVKLNEGSATQMKLTNGNRPDVKTEMKLTHENHSETKLEDKSAMQLQMIHAKNLKEELSNKNKSEARQESEIQTETNLENESQMEQNLTHDTNAQIDTTKESKSEVELPRTNTRPLKSDNSFATIESIDPSKKEVLDGADTNGTKSPVRSQTNDDEASGENQLIADRNSFTRKEWLLMKEELECKLNDEKQRLERWFTEELALIKSKLESDLDQQKAQVIKEEVLLRMEDKLSQLIDIKKHDANVQTEQKVSTSGVVKEARRELHSPVQDEGKRCRCEILEKQVARVEREMQLLKERKLSFNAKKSSSKKNGPVKAKRESWWPESDESSSALSSSFSEWQKPLKEPGWSFASKSSTPLQRARSFLSKHQMRQMHRKSVTLFLNLVQCQRIHVEYQLILIESQVHHLPRFKIAEKPPKNFKKGSKVTKNK